MLRRAGLLSAAVCGLPVTVASLTVGLGSGMQRLQWPRRVGSAPEQRLDSSGAQAELLRACEIFRGQGPYPGGFFNAEPPGKPLRASLKSFSKSLPRRKETGNIRHPCCWLAFEWNGWNANSQVKTVVGNKKGTAAQHAWKHHVSLGSLSQLLYEEERKKITVGIAGGNVIWYSYREKQFGSFSKG